MFNLKRDCYEMKIFKNNFVDKIFKKYKNTTLKAGENILLLFMLVTDFVCQITSYLSVFGFLAEIVFTPPVWYVSYISILCM